MKFIKLIIKILFLCIIVVFGAFNMEIVPVKYFVNYEPLQIPLFIVMIICFFLGMLIVYMLFITDRMKLKRQLNNLKKELRVKENELVKLRNISLTEKDTNE
ncbi:MAG: LapA family protein [Deferribacterota bacterium]|nr:LapA family protein [Deferribacterota bacterium]